MDGQLNEFNPQVIVEAKLTENDGTARDKITRVQHLGTLSMQGRQPHEPPRFEVIACIAGRGFKVRREDMKKLLLSTRGKAFTLENLNRLIECSRLAEFKTRCIRTLVTNVRASCHVISFRSERESVCRINGWKLHVTHHATIEELVIGKELSWMVHEPEAEYVTGNRKKKRPRKKANRQRRGPQGPRAKSILTPNPKPISHLPKMVHPRYFVQREKSRSVLTDMDRLARLSVSYRLG